MASIYDIKPAFQRLLRPLVRMLAAAGVTANQVTLAAVWLSCGIGACVAFFPAASWPLLALPAWLFVRMALNAIDGMLAREHGQKSALGSLLNELGDVVADSALYLPLALVPGFDPRLVVCVVLLAAVTEVASLAAIQIGASRRYDGPMGKSDRAFVFGLLALLAAAGPPPDPWLDGALALVAVLLAWTIVNRVRRALAEVRAIP